jgi:beta-glucosidase
VDSACLFLDDGAAGVLAEYFKNIDFEGKPILSRVEKTVHIRSRHNPDSLFYRDLAQGPISVRWTGRLVPRLDGQHRLKLQCSGDARVFLDDTLVVDHYGRFDATPLTFKAQLQKGRSYKLRVDFVQESSGDRIGCTFGWITPERPQPDQAMLAQAVEAAAKADVAIVCAGWDSHYETEGYDKEDGLRLPRNQEELIEKVALANPNTIVVLNTGTTCYARSWIGKVKGLLVAWYPGQEGGNAIARILFGEVSPSGKLPFSFISDESQTPAYDEYMRIDTCVHYKEGIFVGYRWLDKKNIDPEFPFGFGLSYTAFDYGNLRITPTGKQEYAVSFEVTNTGAVAGEEVAQLYVADPSCSVERPVKELKGFARVALAPGEKKRLTIRLTPRSFAFFDVAGNGWKVEPGEFHILIGSSSRDIRLRGSIAVK